MGEVYRSSRRGSNRSISRHPRCRGFSSPPVPIPAGSLRPWRVPSPVVPVSRCARLPLCPSPEPADLPSPSPQVRCRVMGKIASSVPTASRPPSLRLPPYGSLWGGATVAGSRQGSWGATVAGSRAVCSMVRLQGKRQVVGCVSSPWGGDSRRVPRMRSRELWEGLQPRFSFVRRSKTASAPMRSCGRGFSPDFLL